MPPSVFVVRAAERGAAIDGLKRAATAGFLALTLLAPAAAAANPTATAALRRFPGVQSMHIEQRSAPRSVPDDPALSVPDAALGVAPGTPLQWWAAREGFPAAWSRASARRILVGVIDTGIDGTHPDLRGQIAAAVRPTGDASPRDPRTDEDGHGTHVASLACAATGNGLGLAGAGSGCRLVIEKVDFSDASIAAAIVDATRRGVSVLNMSFGADGRTSAPAATRRALRFALARGVVLVAAVSDSGQPGAPATEQGDPASVLQPRGSGPDPTAGIGLSVTAADAHDRRPIFAGSGSEISMAAYGTYDYGSESDGLARTGPPGIFGAYPSAHTGADGFGACTCRITLGGSSYAELEGTSAAAPQVAGAAALVRALNPDLGPLEVVRLLKRTARREHGWTPDLGWGILDADAAMRAAARLDRRRPASRVRVLRQRQGGRVTVRLTGRDPAPSGVRATGIARFELYASRPGGAPRLVASTRARTFTLRLDPRVAHALFSRAVDRAGNREGLSRHPDARLPARVG